MREVICNPSQTKCKIAPPHKKKRMSSEGLFAASGGTSGLSPEQPSYLVPLSQSAAKKAKAHRKKRSPAKGGGKPRKKQPAKKRKGKGTGRKPLKRLVGGGGTKKRGRSAQKRKCVKKSKGRKKKSA